MDTKKVFSIIFITLGGISMVYGTIQLFNGDFSGYSWAAALLGVIFFSSGMGLLKSAEK